MDHSHTLRKLIMFALYFDYTYQKSKRKNTGKRCHVKIVTSVTGMKLKVSGVYHCNVKQPLTKGVYAHILQWVISFHSWLNGERREIVHISCWE